MKKIITVFLMVLMAQVSALAAEHGTAEYESLKAFKKTQREKKEREKAQPSARAKGFWEREAERSGLAGTGAMLCNVPAAVLPLAKPNSEK